MIEKGTMGNIRLYQFGPLGDQESASPFCVKVRDALRYKRVPFETINATSPMQVRKLNPRGKLPVMIDDGTKLADSTEIIRHLETRHPEPRLYPQDPRTRAMALMIEDWADESLYWHVVYERWQVSEQFAKFAAVVFSPVPAAVRPMVRLLFARQTRGQLRGQGLGRLGVGEQREKFRSAMDWLDSMVDGQFLCGSELSVADVAVAAQVGALNIPFTPVAEAEIHAHAKVMRWLERTSEALG
ncbi:MAG TPA: glutathione S-transferase family protein [Candidatus Binataceae bacterium]|jgi:glutathione S-transferase|nr:glutathione S-transferase family protein [Candidatus Binataceae bacterium]